MAIVKLTESPEQIYLMACAVVSARGIDGLYSPGRQRAEFRTVSRPGHEVVRGSIHTYQYRDLAEYLLN